MEVLEIYAASEEPIAGVTGKTLVAAMREACPTLEAQFGESVEAAVAAVVGKVKAGDVVITHGAGSVSGIAPVLLEALRTK